MQKFTPGPWRIVFYEGYDDDANTVSEIRADCTEHRDCFKTIVFGRAGGHEPLLCSSGPHTVANARLIAAAPDLLAALKNAEAWHINVECPTCDGDSGAGCTCIAPSVWRAAIQKAEGAQ